MVLPTDAFGVAMMLVNMGLQALAEAQKRGLLGGSTSFGDILQDTNSLVSNFQSLLGVWTDPAKYDAINALPQPQKEAEIKRILYPTPLPALVAEERQKLGLDPPGPELA